MGLKVWLHGTRDAENNHRVYSATTLTVALGKRLSNQNVFENKRFLRFFRKRTNNIHKFEGCYLRGQVSLNGFILFNCCIVQPEFY